MKTVHFYFFILAVFFTGIQTQAQRECTGKMVMNDEKTYKVCFTREPIPYKNCFYTKYIIEVDKEEVGLEEFYEVGFRVYKGSDSISVQLLDKARTLAKHFSITYKEGKDCYTIIKDFHANDKNINDTAFANILFNIPNKEEPYVFLNVFKDLTENTYYFLTRIRPDVLDVYNDCIAVGDKSCNQLKEEFHKNETDVTGLKGKMTSYKDEQIKKMEREIETITKRPATQEATQQMQDGFNKKIENILLSQFGNYYTFEDADIDVKFTFRFNGNGSLQDIDMNFINGSKKNWFIGFLNDKIKPLIEKENFQTLPGKYDQSDLHTEFSTYFDDSATFYNDIRQKLCNAIKVCDSNYSLPDNSQSAFYETRKSIYGSFNPFINKQIWLPTAYSYLFRHTTTVSDVTGVWRNEKNEFEYKSGTRSQDLIDNWSLISTAFKEKFAPSSRQRYLVKICTLKINGKLIGFDFEKLE